MRTGNQIGRHASTFELIKAQIARASCVIEDAVVATGEEELTVGPVLVEVDAVRFARALRDHLAQRRVLVREVLTRRDALFANAAFDARVVETLFRVHVKEERVLAQLWHQSTVRAFVIAAAAFRINESIPFLKKKQNKNFFILFFNEIILVLKVFFFLFFGLVKIFK